MWPIVGMVLAGLGAMFGILRGRADPGGYYETDVYQMTGLSHRRFATASIAFFGVFALGAAFPVIPSFLIVAAYLVFLILYGCSFARGATGEDE